MMGQHILHMTSRVHTTDWSNGELCLN